MRTPMEKHRTAHAQDVENQGEIARRIRKHQNYDLAVNERGSLFYFWSILVSICCTYNLLFLTFMVFEDIRGQSYSTWIKMNIVTDIIAILDMVVQARKAFYANGVKMTEPIDTILNYIRSYRFLCDIIAILPTDIFLLWFHDISLIRFNRLFKLHRMRDTFDLAERKHRYQFVITFAKIVLTCSLLFHWNACAYFILSTISLDIANKTRQEMDQDDWPFNFWKITDAYVTRCENFRYQTCGFDETDRNIAHREEYVEELYDFWREKQQRISFSNFSKEYSLSMYWSTLTMTTLGEQPSPNLTFQNVFEIFDTLVGMVIFAMIMGSVGDLVASANAFKADMQMLMDGLKQYMINRKLDTQLQDRVLQYCEYEASVRQTVNEKHMREFLPKKLFVQVNKFLQWRTLRMSPLFEDCEIPFLSDVASTMIARCFGPGDVISAKGDLNKEMFMVAAGELHELDEYDTILRILHPDSIYGEGNLIWFPENKFRNRRPHTLCSTGYSQVYILHRDDFLRILDDYPETKAQVHCRARMIQVSSGQIDEYCKASEEEEQKPLEEILRDFKTDVQYIEDELNRQRSAFNKNCARFKKRVFELESIVINEKKSIKRDVRRKLKRAL